MAKSRKISLRQVLAKNVRNERLLREWSQETLGAKADLSMRCISQVESAKSATSVDSLEKLASAFCIDEHLLLKRY